VTAVRDLIASARAAGAALRPRVWCEGADRLPTGLRAELRAREAEVLRALVVGDAAMEAVPVAPCAACGSGLWWRVSALSGGPGPWTCRRCAPPTSRRAA